MTDNKRKNNEKKDQATLLITLLLIALFIIGFYYAIQSGVISHENFNNELIESTNTSISNSVIDNNVYKTLDIFDESEYIYLLHEDKDTIFTSPNNKGLYFIGDIDFETSGEYPVIVNYVTDSNDIQSMNKIVVIGNEDQIAAHKEMLNTSDQDDVVDSNNNNTTTNNSNNNKPNATTGNSSGNVVGSTGSNNSNSNTNNKPTQQTTTGNNQSNNNVGSSGNNNSNSGSSNYKPYTNTGTGNNNNNNQSNSGSNNNSGGQQQKGHWENVLVRDAWDEKVLVKAAWDEQVLVKEGYWENVLINPAWDEPGESYCAVFGCNPVEVYVCNTCGAVFYDSGINTHISEADHSGWHNDVICTTEEQCMQWATDPGTHHEAEYKQVWHDPEYKMVHHDAEYKTIHHPAEYKKVWVND